MVSHHGPLKSYDLSSGKLVKVYADQVEDVRGLSLSKDGKSIGVATEKKVTVYSTVNGDVVATLDADEKGEFHRISMGRNNSTVIIACDNNTAKIWDYSKSKHVGLTTTRIFIGNRISPSMCGLRTRSGSRTMARR
jgi:WD40 repeat protein